MKKFIKKYFKYFTVFYRFVKWRFFVMLALSVLVGLFDGIGLAMLMPLLELVSNPEAANSENMGNMAFIVNGLQGLGLTLNLTVVLIVMLIIYIIKGFFRYMEAYYKVLLRMWFIKKLRFRMIDGLANLRYEAFVKSDAGKIQNSLGGEAYKVIQAFITYTSALQTLLILLVYLVLAFLSNAQFAFMVVIGGAVTNMVYRSIYAFTKKLSKEVVTVNHNFQGLLIQSVHYFKYLKATGSFTTYGNRLKHDVNAIENLSKKMGVLNSILSATREPLIMLVIVFVILIQVHWLGANLASIILSLLFFYRSLNSLMVVQTSWNGFLNLSGSIENAEEFLQELEQFKDVNVQGDIKGLNNQMALKNVSFRYTANKPVLSKIDLNIKRNETIAFVGESGSGKTTLVNLIVGLLDSYKGSIAVDETNYRDFNIKSLQQKVGYITQEPVVFSDTLYNNITFWAKKTPENIHRFNEALRRAAIYDFVQNLPDKKDSFLGDNGIQLSGGQKQRISIARELYKDVELLLLDEATSALDSPTERTIQENIDALKGKYTIIIVAHRLSTVRNADRIVVLDKGEIEAVGSFDELVCKSERFARMVELQEF